MRYEDCDKYTNSALRPDDTDTYPQRLVGEFITNVISNEWVNKEYKHLVLEVHDHALTAYAGQMFHLLCPSPDGAEVWMRRPMSVYRVNKPAKQIEFLYKLEGRGTRGMGLLAAGDEFNIAGPLGQGFKLKKGQCPTRTLEKHRRSGSGRWPCHSRTSLPAGSRKWCERHRYPECPPSGRCHVERPV